MGRGSEGDASRSIFLIRSAVGRLAGSANPDFCIVGAKAPRVAGTGTDFPIRAFNVSARVSDRNGIRPVIASIKTIANA